VFESSVFNRKLRHPFPKPRVAAKRYASAQKTPMQDMKHFNRATILTILTVGLSGLQSVLLHIGTTDFAHKIFSTYFFIELFIFLLTVITGLKQKIFAILFLFVFVFETVWFCINERPISPDVLLMLIVGAIRIYILIWLLKQLAKNE
jgi:hypothetical protein